MVPEGEPEESELLGEVEHRGLMPKAARRVSRVALGCPKGRYHGLWEP